MPHIFDQSDSMYERADKGLKLISKISEKMKGPGDLLYYYSNDRDFKKWLQEYGDEINSVAEPFDPDTDKFGEILESISGKSEEEIQSIFANMNKEDFRGFVEYNKQLTGQLKLNKNDKDLYAMRNEGSKLLNINKSINMNPPISKKKKNK